MNKQERMMKMKEKVLRKLERDGVKYNVKAKGEGKLIVVENGEVIGELGLPIPQKEFLSVLVKDLSENAHNMIPDKNVSIENFNDFPETDVPDLDSNIKYSINFKEFKISPLNKTIISISNKNSNISNNDVLDTSDSMMMLGAA
ncbi:MULTISPECIES: hypothetical protein [unclassified Exiguobacterium]|uniref:hypothetical protein n=1 Tax=unclassified Exiguobacterium TaxID=2644629 RepID=UPI001BE58DC7|nr:MULTISPECIES: hypothetical protein [unclassified Exiguobacterium]